MDTLKILFLLIIFDLKIQNVWDFPNLTNYISDIRRKVMVTIIRFANLPMQKQ